MKRVADGYCAERENGGAGSFQKVAEENAERSPDRLIDLLLDALWKKEIKKTELFRYFVLETQHNVPMVGRGGGKGG